MAANLALAGAGSDTVNSIRSPASANALVGIRPTKGLLSRAGIMPVSETQDAIGPITRTVADAARLLEAMAGYDQNDPSTAWSFGNTPTSYATSQTRWLRGARMGSEDTARERSRAPGGEQRDRHGNSYFEERGSRVNRA